MRILCDQNVPGKYVAAFRDADGITVATVEDKLEHDATDAEIATYAERNQWVVFTNDDDFFVAGGDHGLLLFDQLEDPQPRKVARAVQQIADVYVDPAEIIESVPGDWGWKTATMSTSATLVKSRRTSAARNPRRPHTSTANLAWSDRLGSSIRSAPSRWSSNSRSSSASSFDRVVIPERPPELRAVHQLAVDAASALG